MKSKYDETEYLKRYIFRWHRDLIPDGEAFPDEKHFRDALPSALADDIAAILSQDDDAEFSSPAAERSLFATLETFNVRLCDALITKHDLKVRRCPQCNRILESPNARLCLWCNYNQYKTDNKSEQATPRKPSD